MNNKSYTDALGNIAWGYLLLHFNINFGSFNMLPNWLGFVFIWQALPAIAARERTASLLAPFVVILGAAELLLWILTLVGVQMEIVLITLLLTCVSLYFHFQLFTNLASIAVQDGLPENASNLRVARTWRTVVLTALMLLAQLGQFIEGNSTIMAAQILLTVVMALLGIILCCILFSYRKSSMQLAEEEVPN